MSHSLLGGFLPQVRVSLADFESDTDRDMLHDDSHEEHTAYKSRTQAEAVLRHLVEERTQDMAEWTDTPLVWAPRLDIAYDDRGGGFWFEILVAETGDIVGEGRALVRSISLTIR